MIFKHFQNTVLPIRSPWGWLQSNLDYPDFNYLIFLIIWTFYLVLFSVVSSAAVIWVVTQRFSPTNGCLNPNQICFPLFSVHVKITECTNHALPIVSSETNHVSVCQFPA